MCCYGLNQAHHDSILTYVKIVIIIYLIMYKLCLCYLSLYCLHIATAATEVTDCSTNCESSVYWFQDLFNGLSDNNRYQTWILSILASCVIGLTGIVPLIIFVPSKELNYQGGSKLLRLLLSFAVGGLLGDVFLHLLPEAWNHIESLGPELHSSHLTLGLWVLMGMFSFVIIEIMFAASQNSKEISDNTVEISGNNFYSEKKQEKQILASSSNTLCNGNSSLHKISSDMQQTFMQNGYLKTSNESRIKEVPKVLQTIHISGYLNLMANSIDNFTHGLAVAASFLVGIKMGMLTTFAILIHEIPHEISDFAILLKSGFNPWNAVKAQVSTAAIGILGAIVALSAGSVDKVGACTSWILPFTSGGFLNIALVNVLPDLLKEKDPWESLKQMVCLCGGIGVMALVNIFVH